VEDAAAARLLRLDRLQRVLPFAGSVLFSTRGPLAERRRASKLRHQQPPILGASKLVSRRIIRHLLPSVVGLLSACSTSTPVDELSVLAAKCADGQVLRRAANGWECATSNWDGLAGKPATYPPEAHAHHWKEILDPPAIFEGPDALLVPLLTSTGFIDGNSSELQQDKRLHLKTSQRWISDQGRLSDLIRLQWTADRAKPALSWLDEKGEDKAAIVAHDKANNPASEDHRHISIETTMDPKGPHAGELFTRMEFPYDADISEIQVHDARFTMAGHYMRISNDDGSSKELRLCRTYSKHAKSSLYPGGYDAKGVGIGMPDYNEMYSARWAVRADSSMETGGNTGSDFRIVRFNDKGAALDAPLFIQRSSGKMGVMTSAPTTALDVNGSGIRIRQPMTPTSSADPVGNVGDWAWDEQHVYVKTSAGWKRSTLESF
jgi:hypothetical protein